MFEAILERGERHAGGDGAVQRPAEEEGRPGPWVRDPEGARRLFSGLVPLPAILGTLPAVPDSALNGLAFPAPDPDRPLFARVAGAVPRLPRRDGSAGATAPALVAPPLPRRRATPPPGFAAVMRRESGSWAVRRIAWAGVGAGTQALLVGAAAVLAAAMASAPPEPELPVVQVRLAPAVARRTDPSRPGLPAAPAAAMARRRPDPTRSRPPATRPPPPTALLQPREVQAAMRPPDPGEPVEDWGEGEPLASEDGILGGVVGGIPGGDGGGAWGAGNGLADAGREAAAPAASQVEDAPSYATAGFRRPVELEAGCVGRTLRLPRELAGFTSGPVTVRFAVGRDGAVGMVEVLGGLPDRRIGAAIEQAIRSCRWRAGADATGRPVALWVILPIRFESA